MSCGCFIAPVFIACMGTAHAHRLEGTQTTVTIEDQTVTLSLHTSPDALTALFGRQSVSDNELHQDFLDALSVRSESGECFSKGAIAFDNVSLTATRTLSCESMKRLELTTELPETPVGITLHAVRVVIDGRMTISQLPSKGVTLQVPVAELRKRWARME